MLAIGDTAAGAMPERPHPGSEVVEGHYIVVFDDSVRNVPAQTSQRERRLGFRADLRYRHALRGFSARLSPGQLQRLRRDPEVQFVSPDRRIRAVGEVPLAPGESAPTGVRRILAATALTAREQSGVGVAVIDTGIELSHPDLNARNGTNCITPGSPANDGDGHGTHVAGTVAASNNGLGVVGVAPDTEVHAVKVLNDQGEGTWSQVICGVDWVTANHEALGIGVANMSLGGIGSRVQPCATTTDALHRAICNSTDAGVNYVVAAGNDGWDFDFRTAPDVPAAYPEVLTVTAVSDSDGEPGGAGGAPSCRPGEADDSAASFSNFARTTAGIAHTIAAPGVCITSTWLGSGYATISGTSMASPHMAGVVALCINEAGSDGPCAGKAPADVIEQVRADAEAHNAANPGYGFFRDPSNSPLSNRYYGFLTRAPVVEAAPPPPPANTAAPELSGTAREGETLATSTGSWSGDPTSYTYRWLRCDAAEPTLENCAEIAAATNPERPLAAADVGHRLRAEVTAQNAGGQATATTAPSAVVEAAPPPPPANPSEGDPPDDESESEQPPVSNQWSFAEVTRYARRGTARLTVAAPGPGTFVLRRTRQVRRAAGQVGPAGRARLAVIPRGVLGRRLSARRCATTGARRLRARPIVRVTYWPAGGAPRTQQRRLLLIRRC